MADIDLAITVPDEPTGGQWETYQSARDKYRADHDTDLNIARFYGACALYEAGIAHVKGYQPLVDALKGKDHKNLPLPLLSAIVVYIALPMEEALNRPLPLYLMTLSDTGLIKINGSVLRDFPDISKPEITTS